ARLGALGAPRLRHVARPDQLAGLLRDAARRTGPARARPRLRRGAQHAPYRRARRPDDGARYHLGHGGPRGGARARGASRHPLRARFGRGAAVCRRHLRLRRRVHEPHGHARSRARARRGGARPQAGRLLPGVDDAPMLPDADVGMAARRQRTAARDGVRRLLSRAAGRSRRVELRRGQACRRVAAAVSHSALHAHAVDVAQFVHRRWLRARALRRADRRRRHAGGRPRSSLRHAHHRLLSDAARAQAALMERVAIVGVGGAGKSTLAVALGTRTGLPVVHLDRLFWKPGWRASEREELVAAQERALPVGGRWIADGNYGGTMPFRLARADTIVFLDLSPSRCLARVLSRAWRSRGRVRADMSEGCPERFWDPSYLAFLWYVLRY